jgi:hypothetical protein
MINDGKNNVPEKTIALFMDRKDFPTFTKNRVPNVLSKPSKKRSWFTPHFYRCLPLTIGNQYGFIVTTEFNFSFEWNGGDSNNDLFFNFDMPQEEVDKLSPSIGTHFGHGIITVNLPFTLRTPPGVNIMTINPPNYIIPNITPMTGVVETDNLRRNFTFNLKVQIPNIRVEVPKGAPIAAFIPIPRYFSDQFNLKFAEDIFTKEQIEEEIKAREDFLRHRNEVEPTLPNKVGRFYFRGEDVYGNKFLDHQN